MNKTTAVLFMSAVFTAATVFTTPVFAGDWGNRSTNVSVAQSASQSSAAASNSGVNNSTSFRDRLQAPGFGVGGGYCSNGLSVSFPGGGFGFSAMERTCKTEISARVANGSIAQRVTARLAGGIRLASGRGRVNINGLTLLMNSRRAVIRGRVAGRQMNVFNAVGRIAIDPDSGVARLGAARLSFTRAAAATVRRSLKLRRAPLGRIGAAAIQVRVPVTVTDPYLAQCGLAATSRSHAGRTDGSPRRWSEVRYGAMSGTARK